MEMIKIDSAETFSKHGYFTSWLPYMYLLHSVITITWFQDRVKKCYKFLP